MADPDPTAEDPDYESPLSVAQRLWAYLLGKSEGGFYGRWDDARGEGVWFYSRDAKAIFEPPPVDEVVYRETDRLRFRSVVFRLGSAAADREGDLCGVVHVEGDPAGDEGPGRPGRRYVVHASFDPAAGLWFKAAILPKPTAATPTPGRVDPRARP